MNGPEIKMRKREREPKIEWNTNRNGRGREGSTKMLKHERLAHSFTSIVLNASFTVSHHESQQACFPRVSHVNDTT